MEDFGEVYAAYWDTVRLFLRRLCGNQDLAEELTQETFYQAMRHWKSFRGDSDISTWLCAIAKRQYYKSLRRKPSVPLTDAPEQAVPDFADALMAGDRRMTAQRMLHRLPEPHREVFMLRTFCDLSHAQIGELFGKSESWARVTYYRARQMLAQKMKEENHDED